VEAVHGLVMARGDRSWGGMQFSQLGGEREACAARGRRAELEEVGCEEELARGGAEGAVGVGTGGRVSGRGRRRGWR
jgi:hypothetical protein